MAVSNVPMRSRFGRLLGVEPGEARALALATGLYFLFAASFVFIQTSAYGLFIQEFGARNLPLAYISIAIFASLLAYLYLKISERVAFKVLAFIDVAFLAAVCLVFWVGLQSRLSHWFVFLLPFWFQAIINLANLIVWPLAGRMFDVRQAKRLFGLIGGGNWLANIFLGGLVVAPLLGLVGTANLYICATLAVVGAGLVLWAIFQGHFVPEAPAPRASQPRRREQPASSPFAKPYNRLIFAYVLLWWVSFYFIDNIFYDRAGAMYPDGAQLAAFIGKQLSVIGIIALITAILLAGRIVRRFGLRAALLTMPVIVCVGMLVLVGAGLLHASASVLFWVSAVAKTLNVALGFSLSLAAGTLLYQPILGAERVRTQTLAEGIVQPLAIGLAGLLLLLFNTALHFSAVELSAVFLVIGAAWLWVIVGLSNHYPHVLSEALVTRGLGESTTLLFDPASIAQLQSSLKSPQPGAVLYALNQLEELDPQVWQTTLLPSLPDLLAHPVPEVRSYVLQRLLMLRLAQPIPMVLARLPQESDTRVYAWAVQYLTALDGDSAELAKSALASPQAAVRRGAITGLLGSGQAPKIDEARAALHQMAASSNAGDRLMAAKILSDVACPGAEPDVRLLLTDDVLSVRQAAVRAAARQPHAELMQDVVTACYAPGTASIAEQTLISYGSAALPSVLEAWGKDGKSSAEPGMFSLGRVLGRVADERATQALQSRMDCHDAELRLQVLRSLSASGFRMHSRQQLFARLKPELAQAAWLTAAIDTLERAKGPRDLAILSDALCTAFSDARRRALLLLSLGLNSQTMLRAAQALDEAGDSPSAFALEAVDAMLPPAWKPLVLPLMEGLPWAERLKRWRTAGIEAPALTVETVVNGLVAADSRGSVSLWATMCALHVAGVMQLRTCEPAVRSLISLPDSPLSKLACWSLAEMGFDVPVQGEAIMLSLVEKVLALKSAALFRETPDNVLADVAERVQEVAFDKGQTIFHKGDPGDSLYIIVSGKVRVRDGSRLLNELSDGAIFGELALLDPEPRSATVSAVEPTHLLQLDAAHFHLVLAERPEVATAIIHVLTSYIRRLLKDDSTSGGRREFFEP